MTKKVLQYSYKSDFPLLQTARWAVCDVYYNSVTQQLSQSFFATCYMIYCIEGYDRTRRGTVMDASAFIDHILTCEL